MKGIEARQVDLILPHGIFFKIFIIIRGSPGKMNDSYPVYKVEFRSRDILFTSGSLNKKASRQTKTIFR